MYDDEIIRCNPNDILLNKQIAMLSTYKWFASYLKNRVLKLVELKHRAEKLISIRSNKKGSESECLLF